MDKSYLEIENNPSAVDLNNVPVIEYDRFYTEVSDLLRDGSNHCLSYHGFERDNDILFICLIADDSSGKIRAFSFRAGRELSSVKSLTTQCPAMHVFEREIHENLGIDFDGHPWLKPVRYPFNRKNRDEMMDNYPFYRIGSEELHEVGVGPIHAGVIEPGHFRFICNGEKVLHLEIHLGYQHRGIENMLSGDLSPLQRCILSESIAGDTSVGHSIAHVQAIESLSGIEPVEKLQIERSIALELERIAVHIGDMAALCGDVAYQLGQAVCEALRTTIINSTQNWCGNRFGKGLVRTGGTNYPLNDSLLASILKTLDDTGRKYAEITERIFSVPSVLARFEDIGTVTAAQASSIGAVGMAARTCGIPRDIRRSHPFQYFRRYGINPVTTGSGDVLARARLRELEVTQSIKTIKDLAEIWDHQEGDAGMPVYAEKLKPGMLAVSLVEGWRGEICHSVLTDSRGKIVNYKVKDPSFHNWMALALAVRNQEISDFPVCNKSFNLSYCGNDL
ncbi:MAG: NADH dehydrogenase subunit [Bacteroidales bacterium]|nr:NADH dehydrogenase subunit [Bacteroidales bacterium]